MNADNILPVVSEGGAADGICGDGGDLRLAPAPGFSREVGSPAFRRRGIRKAGRMRIFHGVERGKDAPAKAGTPYYYVHGSLHLAAIDR